MTPFGTTVEAPPTRESLRRHRQQHLSSILASSGAVVHTMRFRDMRRGPLPNNAAIHARAYSRAPSSLKVKEKSAERDEITTDLLKDEAAGDGVLSCTTPTPGVADAIPLDAGVIDVPAAALSPTYDACGRPRAPPSVGDTSVAATTTAPTPTPAPYGAASSSFALPPTVSRMSSTPVHMDTDAPFSLEGMDSEASHAHHPDRAPSASLSAASPEPSLISLADSPLSSSSLCRAGCGFYGNIVSGGLCSRCAKDDGSEGRRALGGAQHSIAEAILPNEASSLTVEAAIQPRNRTAISSGGHGSSIASAAAISPTSTRVHRDSFSAVADVSSLKQKDSQEPICCEGRRGVVLTCVHCSALWHPACDRQQRGQAYPRASAFVCLICSTDGAGSVDTGTGAVAAVSHGRSAADDATHPVLKRTRVEGAGGSEVNAVEGQTESGLQGDPDDADSEDLEQGWQ